MNLNPLSWFSKPKRQRRFVLNVHQDIALTDLVELLRRHTPVLSAKDYNRLPANLKALFVPSRKT